MRIRLRDIIHNIKNQWLKCTRGIGCCDLVSLDQYQAKRITKELRLFKDKTSSYPPCMTFEEWKDTLDKMIYSFEYYASNEKYTDTPSILKQEKLRAGLDLYAKHFTDLWI